MEQSILLSTKTVLKVNPAETYFDEELLQYINGAISHLGDLGVGDGTFEVVDSSAVWADLGAAPPHVGMVKQFVFLKTKQRFDEPGTSYHVESLEKQIRELEWRITNGPGVQT